MVHIPQFENHCMYKNQFSIEFLFDMSAGKRVTFKQGQHVSACVCGSDKVLYSHTVLSRS